jgi:hypothetical protein
VGGVQPEQEPSPAEFGFGFGIGPDAANAASLRAVQVRPPAATGNTTSGTDVTVTLPSDRHPFGTKT